MTVAVQQPQNDDFMSDILKGLSIAQSIYGIKTDRAKYEALAKKEAEKSKLDAAGRSGLSGKELAEMQAKGTTVSPTPFEGGIKVPTYDATGNMSDVYVRPPVKEAKEEMTAYQRAQLEHQGKVDAVRSTEDATDTANTKQSQETNLRKEYDDHPVTKDTEKMMVSYKKLKKAAENENPTAATDIGIVFNFMKMVDPASTVREGEFATAQNAGSIGDKLMNMYNSTLKGERLQPEQRTAMAQEAFDQLSNQLEQQNGINDRYSGIAKMYGLHSGNVTRQYELKPIESKVAKEQATHGITPDEARAELARRRGAGGGLQIPGGGMSIPSMGVK